MSQWVTIAELRARRQRYMMPMMYGTVQMMASMSYEESVAVREKRLAEALAETVFTNRDRPKRRYHPMKEILMLQPRGPRLLVKRVDAPKPTSSTIIIPETIDGELLDAQIVMENDVLAVVEE